jgi:hypothetical protein
MVRLRRLDLVDMGAVHFFTYIIDYYIDSKSFGNKATLNSKQLEAYIHIDFEGIHP